MSQQCGVGDFYIKNKVKCSTEKKEEFRKNVLNNMNYIESNEYLSIEKKVQFKLFVKSFLIYDIIFKFYRRIRRV